MEINAIVIQDEFREYLKKENLLSPKDYFQITKMCNATRHHVKNVIENRFTTNQEVYDAIIKFYAEKKKNIDNQKNIVENGF